jgi:hypothetical protein
MRYGAVIMRYDLIGVWEQSIVAYFKILPYLPISSYMSCQSLPTSFNRLNNVKLRVQNMKLLKCKFPIHLLTSFLGPNIVLNTLF